MVSILSLILPHWMKDTSAAIRYIAACVFFSPGITTRATINCE
jgi:hypothetical protein